MECDILAGDGKNDNLFFTVHARASHFTCVINSLVYFILFPLLALQLISLYECQLRFFTHNKQHPNGVSFSFLFQYPFGTLRQGTIRQFIPSVKSHLIKICFLLKAVLWNQKYFFRLRPQLQTLKITFFYLCNMIITINFS